MAYIDTEGTFRAEKIRAIAARFDLDADAVLDNVSSTQWLNIIVPVLSHQCRLTLQHMPASQGSLPSLGSQRPAVLSIARLQIIHARAYTHEAQTGEHACKSCPDTRSHHNL